MENREVVYQDINIEVVKQGEYLELNYKTPHIIRIKAGDRQAIDDEVIRMLKMRTEVGSKYFVQKEVGRIIGVSRQMINQSLAGVQAGRISITALWRMGKIQNNTRAIRPTGGDLR